MESGSYISNVQEDSASIREQLTLSTPAAVSFALGNNSGRGWEGHLNLAIWNSDSEDTICISLAGILIQLWPRVIWF